MGSSIDEVSPGTGRPADGPNDGGTANGSEDERPTNGSDDGEPAQGSDDGEPAQGSDDGEPADGRATDDDRDGADERLARAVERADAWRTRGWTTIVLEERSDGAWRATQRGVGCEGRGETAAAAAAAYCRRIDGDG